MIDVYVPEVETRFNTKVIEPFEGRMTNGFLKY